jgi:hypothetical protein
VSDGGLTVEGNAVLCVGRGCPRPTQYKQQRAWSGYQCIVRIKFGVCRYGYSINLSITK